MPTVQTVTPTTGTDGRIKNRTGGADYVLATMTAWDLNIPVQVAPLITFESTASAEGVVFPTNKYPTLGDWSASMAGVFSMATSNEPQSTIGGMKNGARVILDFVVSKGSGLGYPSATGIIKNFKVGQKMENNLCTFTAELDGYGVPPTFGAVS
jgi:hypothetical protein